VIYIMVAALPVARRVWLPVVGSLDKLAAHSAAQGYVVASINYRLSSEAKFSGTAPGCQARFPMAAGQRAALWG